MPCQHFAVQHLAFILLLVGVLGCRESASPPAPAPPAVVPANPTQQPSPTAPPATSQKLEKPGDVTPRQLLEKMVAVYQSASSYSDHGQIHVVAKMLAPEAQPEPWPCTVAFQKQPSSSKLRLEIGDGKLVADGVDVFAQIRPFPDQVLRFPAPEPLTLEHLFQDVYLDQAMELGLPETILRFPPQLILLFARDPLKTLLPGGDDSQTQVELREPRWMGDIPCDLIRVTDAAGSRVLWISRANLALVRFDYIVEGLPVPEGVASIRLVRIDMPDAQFDGDIVEEAFQMQQPVDAVSVTEFLPPELAPKTAFPPTEVTALTPQPTEQEMQNFQEQLERHRKAHQALLRSMTEQDFYALPAAEPEPSTAPAIAKAPEQLELIQAWTLPLTGASQIAVLPPTTEADGEEVEPRLLVPYEGNLLAVIDVSGKIRRQEKPAGVRPDELVTLVRVGQGTAGRKLIGLSSPRSRTVHVFDADLNPIVADLAPEEPAQNRRQMVSDFCFAHIRGDEADELLEIEVGVDESARASLRAIDLADRLGTVLWQCETEPTPVQMGSCVMAGRRWLLCLCMDEHAKNRLLIYDTEGQKQGEVRVGDERRILRFGVDHSPEDNPVDSRVCVLSSGPGDREVRIEGVNFAKNEAESADIETEIVWSRPLPDGLYQHVLAPIAAGDWAGDTQPEWFIPAPDGTITVLSHDGTPLDSFSFGKIITGLAVANDGTKRLLVVTDVEGVTAWEVK